MIGETISHYKIIEKLGEGGMGVVYKAEDTKLKRTVALKFLPPGSTSDTRAKERFIREAQAASALEHPNICNIHEIDETAEGQLFICMACYDGESLRQKISRGPLNLEEALGIAAQVALGLSKAHEHGIVHRDIKPANVLITGDGHAKILDFGLAKLAHEPKLTRAGSTTGTVAYMSPEQASGRDVDHRTDIWALGVVLYEMITGRRPFRAAQEQAIIRSIIDDQPEPLTALRTGVPLEIERTVVKCMYKSPGERYQTATDLLADLHRVQRELKEEASIGRTRVLHRPEERRSARWAWAIPLAAAVAVAAWIAAQHLSPRQQTSIPGRKMLVVLPFENLGDAEDEYFADGITEEITARLAGIKGLGVIARTSAVNYKNSEKTIRQIGDDLGVDYVLEGTVRWQRGTEAVSQVRVTPQLIRVTDQSHIWADVYQEDTRDVFRVQSGIAEQVARALDVELLEPKRSALETRSTKSLEAYQAYLRAVQREPLGYGYEDLSLMEEMLSRAIDLDPEFALAHALLSRTHSRFYIFEHDRSAERLAKARAAAERALGLAPDLPEGHLALGTYYYSGFRDYEKALAELEIAERARPSDTDVLFLKGVIYKRQARFEDALEVYFSAAEMDPLDAQLADEIGIVCRFLRRYQEAERYFNRAISLAPDQTEGYAQKANLYRVWHGDLGMARDVLEQMPPTRSDEWFTEWYYQEYFERDFRAALDWLGEREKKPDGQVVAVAFLHHLMGQEERALALYDSARAELEIKAAARPEDPSVRRGLANAYSGLGWKEEALREIRLAMETPELSGDIPGRYEALETLAAIYAESGEYVAAVEQLEYLLSVRSSITVPLLLLDPQWDPLREHHGFKRLLEEYSVTAP